MTSARTGGRIEPEKPNLEDPEVKFVPDRPLPSKGVTGWPGVSKTLTDPQQRNETKSKWIWRSWKKSLIGFPHDGRSSDEFTRSTTLLEVIRTTEADLQLQLETFERKIHFQFLVIIEGVRFAKKATERYWCHLRRSKQACPRVMTELIHYHCRASRSNENDRQEQPLEPQAGRTGHGDWA